MSEGYELLESLGPAHPSQVSLTVAEATERELLGIPLAISGDPVPHKTQPFPTDREWQHNELRSRPLREDWMPVADTEAAPVVETEAAVGIWPAPSHEALTESITALAGVQRRLMIGGRLGVWS